MTSAYRASLVLRPVKMHIYLLICMCNINGGYFVHQYLFVRPGDCHLMCIACFLGENDEG